MNTYVVDTYVLIVLIDIYSFRALAPHVLSYRRLLYRVCFLLRDKFQVCVKLNMRNLIFNLTNGMHFECHSFWPDTISLPTTQTLNLVLTVPNITSYSTFPMPKHGHLLETIWQDIIHNLPFRPNNKINFFSVMQLMARSTGTTGIPVSLIKAFYLSSIHLNLKALCYIQIHIHNKHQQ